uniref:Glycosyltransferase family 92 protein n=3 Tax=Parascaris univalens TaxID=6257 RepID=A0A915CGL7_PARUN
MFRRHCIISYILPKYEWILVVDADVGVINPTRLIEEFIDDKYDLIFFDRFFNWEISCSSYLARSSTESVEFIKNFAEYEKNLPNSVHGRDNGAIHFYIVERLIAAISKNEKKCREIWDRSKNYDDLFAAEACIRILLSENEHFNPHMKILSKGKAWVRDVFLTRGMWNWQRDFMLHGLKNEWLVRDKNVKLQVANGDLSRWYDPFTRLGFNESKCVAQSEIWHWDAELIVDETSLDVMLRKQFIKADNWFHKSVKDMQRSLINISS